MAKQSVRIYHNPRCTKSRETLALLRERGVEPEAVTKVTYRLLLRNAACKRT